MGDPERGDCQGDCIITRLYVKIISYRAFSIRNELVECCKETISKEIKFIKGVMSCMTVRTGYGQVVNFTYNSGRGRCSETKK